MECIANKINYGFSFFGGQGPLVKDFTPSQLATQALPYVLPSHPQTGSYCMVQAQSLILGPIQSSAGNFVPLQLNKNNTAIIVLNFIYKTVRLVSKLR